MEVGTTFISSYQVKVILDAAESQHHQADIWLVCLNTIMIEEQKKRGKRGGVRQITSISINGGSK